MIDHQAAISDHVAEEGVELNKDGIDEHDGILIFKENYFCDDGAYMVIRIIIEMVRMKLDGANEGIGILIKDLEEPLESAELRMDVMSEPRHAKAKAIEVIETFKNYIELGGWKFDSCEDCSVSDNCLVDATNSTIVINAHMYRAKVSDERHGEYGWVHIRQTKRREKS
ncbi:hypothetical protein POM88_009148 [Heracleum sosnowskyi]|uniref:Uncharacterized protein n=1 Tax=Heracleum sosnowskyi TaxID=360622 RepID=A0AAD8N2F2_9APIA|nr:hypothetical protein POM88_009148 [Heracleum sosnowskyi]